MSFLFRSFAPLALAAALALLSACGGGGTEAPAAGGTSGSTDSNGGSTGSTGAHAGMGPSTSPPTGQAYAWADGVQVDQPVKGDDPFCVPPDQKDKPRTGSGGLVRICLGFHNTGGVPITVTLPPGLIFVSDDQAVQNGIVVQRTVIELPASTTTYYGPVLLYCLNKGRSPTAGGQNTYATGPVTDDPAVLDLLSLLKDKQLPATLDMTVQESLWHVTDGDGLTQADRDAIAGL